jgi:hypothetical protein
LAFASVGPVNVIKKRIVAFSDLHVGSTVGLWPGTFPVEGGGTYTVNIYQRWLLECWYYMYLEISRMDPKPIIVVVGDPVQGTHDRDGMLVTPKTDIQANAAYVLLKPIREIIGDEFFYMVRGTEWHEGKSAENVEQLAEKLGARRDPASGQSTWWEVYYDIGSGAVLHAGSPSPVIHFAHHTGKSSVAWYEATVPLRDLLMQVAELTRFFENQAPNLKMAVRAHRHRYVHVDVPPDLHAVVCPGWQLKTGFGFKVAHAMLPEIGYIIIEWDGKDLTVKPRLFQLPPIHVEGAL